MDSPLQAALAAIDGTEVASAASTDERLGVMVAKCRALITGYHGYWRDSGLRTVAAEAEFRLPIINPKTGARSRTYVQGGKIDGLVRLASAMVGDQFVSGDGLYNVEHKTTSEDIEEADAPYWRRLVIDSQVSMYALAGHQAGQDILGTIYDVIRKPTINPKQIVAGSKNNVRGTAYEIRTEGTYFGMQVQQPVIDDVASKKIERETPELYGYRLFEDIQQRPRRYYQRRMIPRLDADLLEWAQELWHGAQDIALAKRDGRNYRNSGACVAYGTTCDYLGICSGFDTPDSDRWKKREHVHSELGETFGNDVITHSRYRCFQSCRRKHYYRYELGIERVEREEREALEFGTLMHTALEAWFNCFKTEDVCQST